MRLAALALVFAVLADAAPRRVLLFTHSAGYRHDSIPAARSAFESIAALSNGRLEVVSSEDLSLINSGTLRAFDVLFFFTSGELALNEQQRRDLLAFVSEGKGFGGAHSATDTLYSWPEFGELIGAYFDGHPWVQEGRVDIEDPDHPATRPYGTSFAIVEEFYQFRNFSRDRVRVLMTLDTASVNMQAAGINRTDGDFALAWCRNYGRGRVFYTALGHFDQTWQNPAFRASLSETLLWLAGETEANAAPRSATPVPRSLVNAASFADSPVAPGSLVSLFGTGLTSGSTMAAKSFPLPRKLAGTAVLVDGKPAPILFASPTQINLQLPSSAADSLVVRSGVQSASGQLRLQPVAPGIFVATSERIRSGEVLTLYATGLGTVDPAVPDGLAAPLQPLSHVTVQPVVSIGGIQAQVQFAGLAPGFAGLYQINAVVPSAAPAGPVEVRIESGGQPSNSVRVTVERP
jgi:uncharacterized protein (TIGR03437 family)